MEMGFALRIAVQEPDVDLVEALQGMWAEYPCQLTNRGNGKRGFLTSHLRLSEAEGGARDRLRVRFVGFG